MRVSTSGNVDRWLPMLRISIGIIYIWFGSLKFFPGVSPAEDLAKETIRLLTFGLIKPDLSLLLLALWETIAGALLIVGLYQKWVIRVLLVHMCCTFMPLFLLPGLSFTAAPFVLTLVGQYIIKNIVIVSTLLVLDTSSKKKEMSTAKDT
ncbi:MAG TPA: DoxX family membrane protein [Chryseolinea sp.]